MKILHEVRKENDYYYKGAFWIIADSVYDILTNNFTIEGSKILCSYESKLDRTKETRKNETHESVWKNLALKYNYVPYNYYPRGKVEVYNGIAYININSILNNPNIIDKIRQKYSIEKLEYHVGLNDMNQGSHYDFFLK